MVSREHKKAALLHEKLQLLRSITNSHANDPSILQDASKYIEELKHKVQILNQDIASSGQSSSYPNTWPVVTVETVEKGIQVNLSSERSCPGLLVFVLKVFEELNLNVLEARVSCTGSFHLEALGAESEENGESIDTQLLKQSILNAIENWSESNDHQDT
ncbi:transcription factor bHLH61-like isoform X2 [Rutidosis leptorrhynchoides]|uniref:transcription factor bHLH61-like isoform X2 n=1 Tax=Rutidosis leptorrhynchoides TaxID=125765 RepID=UPI003A99E4AB